MIIDFVLTPNIISYIYSTAYPEKTLNREQDDFRGFRYVNISLIARLSVLIFN